MTRALRTSAWSAGARVALAFVLACPLGLGGTARVAYAQGRPPSGMGESPSSNEPKTREQLEAQQHFQRAKDLYSAGSYREAVSELEAARALDPKAKDLVFNLGIVHEKLAKFDAAIAFFRQYQEMDGVTAAERAKAENIIKRIEGAKRELPPKPPPTERQPQQPAEDEPHGRIDAATVGVGAGAIVALGVGATFGILALSKKPSSSFVTGRDGSYADLQGKTDDAHRMAVVSDIGLGVGIVAAAVTAVLFFARTKEPSKTGLVPSFSPLAGGGALGLGGSFR